MAVRLRSENPIDLKENKYLSLNAQNLYLKPNNVPDSIFSSNYTSLNSSDNQNSSSSSSSNGSNFSAVA